MTVPTLQMEVKKDGLRQMQDGTWNLSLKVHPNDMPVDLMQALMGTRYMCVIAQIGDDCQPSDVAEHNMPMVPEEVVKAHQKPRLQDRTRDDQ